MAHVVPPDSSSKDTWGRSSDSDNITLRRPETPEEPNFVHRENLFALDMPGGSNTRYPYPDHGEEGSYHFHGEHGPPVDDLDHQHDLAEEEYDEHSELMWMRVRHYIRDPVAEFLGTMIMIIFGDGSVAQVTLSANPDLPASAQNKGDYQSISWGWGIGVMLAVYVAGCAGGHLNPAVTFVNCLFRGFPWKKFPVYVLAQVLGCFCGAAIIYGNYNSAINAYEGGPNIRTVPGYSDTATAGIFCTYPAPFMSTVGMFFSEFIASAVLVFVIFALKDDANLGAGHLVPLALFFLIFGIGATLGWETGYAINLARDFGPRLFTYAIGYGANVFRAGNWYFWIPIVSPFLGGTFGGFLYDLLIYTGESPINTSYLGFGKLMGMKKNQRRVAKREDRDPRCNCHQAEREEWHEKPSGGTRMKKDLESGTYTMRPSTAKRIAKKDSGVSVGDNGKERGESHAA